MSVNERIRRRVMKVMDKCDRRIVDEGDEF